jgi:hypothetical protein
MYCYISSGTVAGGSGDVRITGLPFTCDSIQAGIGAVLFGRVDLTNTLGAYAVIPIDTDYIRFSFNVDNANGVTLQASALNGNTTPYISGTITYKVA